MRNVLRFLTVTTTLLCSSAYAADTAAQVDRFMVDQDGTRIETLAQGHEPLIVMLRSLGRSGEDYSQTPTKPTVSACCGRSRASSRKARVRWSSGREVAEVVITGAAMDDRSADALKPARPGGDPEHGSDASVEGALTCGFGPGLWDKTG